MKESFQRAAREIENIMLAHESPQKELFERYLGKSAGEREAFVLALIGAYLVKCARQ
jgi:hypothetical protein